MAWAIVWRGWFRDRLSEDHAPDGSGAKPFLVDLVVCAALRSRNFWTLLPMYRTYCWGGHFYISPLHTYLEEGRGFAEPRMEVFSTFPFLLGGATA
ncbi:MAG: hypothetical protein ABI165_21760 [Bryobacteraceae bacterium]